MLWAEYTSRHQAIRLHLCFELNRMIPAHFLVDTGKSNEKKALLHMLEAGVTYIADRGYLSFPLLASIVAAQAFFIVRAKSNLVYQRVKRMPVDLPAPVQHIFLHVTDQRVRLSNAKDQPIYRLVSFFVGQERYLILTNRLDLTTFQIILLYAYRWQVELIFRFLKRSLNGLHLPCTCPYRTSAQSFQGGRHDSLLRPTDHCTARIAPQTAVRRLLSSFVVCRPLSLERDRPISHRRIDDRPRAVSRSARQHLPDHGGRKAASLLENQQALARDLAQLPGSTIRLPCRDGFGPTLNLNISSRACGSAACHLKQHPRPAPGAFSNPVPASPVHHRRMVGARWLSDRLTRGPPL